MFPAIIQDASVPLLAQAFVAAVLSWVDLALYRVSQDPKTSKADAVLLDLIFGLLTVLVVVIWFGVSLGLW